MTCGFSRDDAEAKFLPLYVSQGILPADPFEELDTTGVGELIKLAAERGKATRPALHLGICGERPRAACRRPLPPAGSAQLPGCRRMPDAAHAP